MEVIVGVNGNNRDVRMIVSPPVVRLPGGYSNAEREVFGQRSIVVETVHQRPPEELDADGIRL